jgi:carbohydrate-selective porin OprB
MERALPRDHRTRFSICTRCQANGVHPAATVGSDEHQASYEGENAIAQSLFDRKYLLGGWKGERSTVAEKGVTFDFYYMDDALANPYGGREDAGVWGRSCGSADVDFSKFTSWQGLTFHLRAYGNMALTSASSTPAPW